MSGLNGYESIIECPYNRAHQLLKHRFQTHLVKCRKNYPNVQKVQCPYNAVHLINELELKVFALKKEQKEPIIIIMIIACFSSTLLIVQIKHHWIDTNSVLKLM